MFRVNGVRVGVIGATVRTTPELVRADATAGLEFLDEAERIQRESRAAAPARRAGAGRRHPRGRDARRQRRRRAARRRRGRARSSTSSTALQDTTVDLVIAGHTHRAANTVVGRHPGRRGLQRGRQLLGRAAAGARRRRRLGRHGDPRREEPRRRAARPTCKAIVDAANAETAVLRNEVIGTQSGDILRDPTRLSESAMGNLVADAMRGKYPDVEAALTNSGGLRADLRSPPAVERRRGGRRDHLGRGVRRAAVRQPHGDHDAHRRAAHRGAAQRLQPGVQPGVPGGTGRFPQVSALKITYHCTGTTPVVDSVWPRARRAGRDAHADRPGGHGPHRHQRLHVRRWRRLHGARGRHGRPAAGARCSTCRSSTSAPTRPISAAVEGRIVRG